MMKNFLLTMLMLVPLVIAPRPEAQKRVALVIGVKDYVSQPLSNNGNGDTIQIALKAVHT